jgi:hypothetical protein
MSAWLVAANTIETWHTPDMQTTYVQKPNRLDSKQAGDLQHALACLAASEIWHHGELARNPIRFTDMRHLFNGTVTSVFRRPHLL